MKKYTKPLIFGASIALVVTASTTSAYALMNEIDNNDASTTSGTVGFKSMHDKFTEASYIKNSPKEVFVKTALDKEQVHLTSDGSRVALSGEQLVFPNSYETKEEGDYDFALATLDSVEDFIKKDDVDVEYIGEKTIHDVKVKEYYIDSHGQGSTGTMYKDDKDIIRGYTSKSGEVDIFITEYNQ